MIAQTSIPAIALSLASVAACAAPRNPPPTIAVVAVASTSGSAPDAASPTPPIARARGEVTIGFFTAENESWPQFEPNDPIVARVTPCYTTALRDDAALVGWIVVDLAFASDGTPTARLVESSPVPEKLVACVVERLRGAAGTPGESSPARRVYVSMR